MACGMQARSISRYFYLRGSRTRTAAIAGERVTKINNVEVTEIISPPPPVLKEHAGRMASAAQLLLECLESRLAEQLTTLDVARVQRAACIDDDSHARVGQELAPAAEQRAKLGASDVQARERGAVREVEQLERRAEHLWRGRVVVSTCMLDGGR